MTVLPSTLAALSTPSFAAAKYVLTMSFGRKPIFNGFPAADEAPDEAAADGAVVAAADAAVVAAADAAADGTADPPELEHAANTTAATLMRAIPRSRVLIFKAVPPLPMTTLAHLRGPSRPVGDVPRGLDRRPTWPGEQRWG